MEKFERHHLIAKRSRFQLGAPIVRRGARLAVVLMLAGAMPACSSTPTSDIQIHTAIDHKANLAGYKSFAWHTSEAVLHDGTGVWVPRNTDTQSEIEFLVDKELREKGLTVVKEQPDLLVHLMIVADVNDVQEIEKTRGDALSSFDPVGQGALLVELIDAQTGKTVWMGGAEGELRQSRSPEESKQRLSYAVDKIFAQLPR
jgi:uncharacterized protein DUF4136